MKKPVREDLRDLAIILTTVASEMHLLDEEVDDLLGLKRGTWPMKPSVAARRWHPEGWQEARARQLVEICCFAASAFGQSAPQWFRTRSAALGVAPLAFMLWSPGALLAVRDAFRAELGAA